MHDIDLFRVQRHGSDDIRCVISNEHSRSEEPGQGEDFSRERLRCTLRRLAEQGRPHKMQGIVETHACVGVPAIIEENAMASSQM